MQKSIRNILALMTLSGLLGNGAALAEETAKRERPTPEQRAERQQQAKERFKKIDTNQDGTLSRDEAAQGAPKLAEHFDKLDANGDGQVAPAEIRAARRHRAERAPGQGKQGPRTGG